MSEIARFKDRPDVLESLIDVFIDLDKHAMISEAFMFEMRTPLRDFLELFKLADVSIPLDKLELA